LKIAILGGGLTGLSAAEILSRNHDVTIYECDSQLGGMAASYLIPIEGKSYHVTKTYHHLLIGDDATINAISNCGLNADLNKKKVFQGFLYQGKVHGFSTPMEILSFPIPIIDKIKLAKFTLIDAKKKDWSSIEHLNAKQWIEMTAGKNNYDVFFEKLVQNKFHCSPEEISAPWLGTRFVKESSSFLKKFMWLKGGIIQLINGYEKKIRANGGMIRKNLAVESVSDTNNGVKVTHKEGEDSFDCLISTVSPEIFLKLAQNVPPELKETAEKVRYLSCICATVVVKGIFTDRYWINVLDRNMHISALFQHSVLYEDSAPEGVSIFYISTYLMRDEELWSMDDESVMDIYLSEVNMFFPGFKANVLWMNIARFRDAEAIYEPGYKNIKENYGNLYFAGIYKIFPKIRNMASAIEEGEKIAGYITGEKNV